MMQSVFVLRRLLSFAEPAKALPALLAGTLAVLSAVGLIGTAAWIIASAALRPPLSALALAITRLRHRARGVPLPRPLVLSCARLRLL